MKKKWLKILTCLLSVIMLFNISIISFADAKKLDVKRVRQAKSKWCWAASSEMVGTYGISTSRDQEAIVAFIWGSTLPDVGGSANNEAAGIEYVSEYKKDALISSKILSFNTIKGQINGNRPVLANLRWNSGSGHAIVFSGYSGDRIYCIDPWEDTASTYYAYEDLKNGGDFSTGSGRVIGNVYYRNIGYK